MHGSVQKVRIADIDLVDRRFSCSCPQETASLADSIKRVGLLRPVMLLPKGECYAVASGLRRALAVKQLGHDLIDGVILEAPAPENLALFRMNLEDNLATRTLNFFEKALAVHCLKNEFHLPVDSPDFKHFLQILGLSNDRRSLDRYLALAELDEGIKTFILDRGWSDRHADAFVTLDTRSASALLAVAERMRLTAGHVRELSESATEIAERDALDFKAVLRTLESFECPEGANTGQMREAFVRKLREIRYPAFSRAQAEMEKCLSTINALKGISVQAPPFLEGDTFTAALSFRTAQELAGQANALLEFGSSDALRKAISLLE